MTVDMCASVYGWKLRKVDRADRCGCGCLNRAVLEQDVKPLLKGFDRPEFMVTFSISSFSRLASWAGGGAEFEDCPYVQTLGTDEICQQKGGKMLSLLRVPMA